MPSTWDMLTDELAFQGDRFKRMGQAIASDLGGMLAYPQPAPAFGTQSPAEAAEQPPTPVARAGAAIPQGMGMLAKNAIESSEAMRRGEGYDPKPVVDAATLAMGGGLPVETPGVTLNVGFKRPVRGFHATNVPTDFTEFKPSPRDLGTSFSVEPGVAMNYAFRNSSPMNARTIPVISDIKKAYQFPVDAGPWNNPDRVMSQLQFGGGDSLQFKKLSEELNRVAGQPGSWEENFPAYFQNKGYSAINFPHGGSEYHAMFRKPDSFMVFNPSDVVPLLSERGQEMLARQGATTTYPKTTMASLKKSYPWLGDESLKIVKESVPTPGMLTPNAQNKIDMWKALFYD